MNSMTYLSQLMGAAHRGGGSRLDAVQPVPGVSATGVSATGVLATAAWTNAAWTNGTKRLLGLIGATSG